mmetsp:Transcript_35030/g.87656  ORF Transcript_35030/g.87656 Transcript_35030/m.87656 type:complete len:296 (+) Transcript_35030:688-1575(+)
MVAVAAHRREGASKAAAARAPSGTPRAAAAAAAAAGACADLTPRRTCSDSVAFECMQTRWHDARAHASRALIRNRNRNRNRNRKLAIVKINTTRVSYKPSDIHRRGSSFLATSIRVPLLSTIKLSHHVLHTRSLHTFVTPATLPTRACGISQHCQHVLMVYLNTADTCSWYTSTLATRSFSHVLYTGSTADTCSWYTSTLPTRAHSTPQHCQHVLYTHSLHRQCCRHVLMVRLNAGNTFFTHVLYTGNTADTCSCDTSYTLRFDTLYTKPSRERDLSTYLRRLSLARFYELGFRV